MPGEATSETLSATPFQWKRLWVILALVAIAGFETWDGWTNLAIPDSISQRSVIGGIFLVAHIVSQPILGAAALVFALIGRARYAIIVLAANIVLRWLTADLFDPANWKITGLWSAQETIVNLVIMPIAGLTAGSFAARNIRLGLATFLVCLPTLYLIVVMVGFTISVLIYGF
ncbi:MAG: hypothetical protein K2X60_00850 [Xanthobacteraceae bacterium]|nr:hypothetical protein [Xanthobacteraceae bacterium]